METSNQNKNATSTILINFFGLNNYKSILNKIFNFAHANFPEFCTLFSAFTFILFWYTRTLAYCYQSGTFHMYNISSKYIEINDNFFFQLIEYIAISTIIIFSNFIFISIHVNTTKEFARFIRKLLFFVIEISAIFFIVAFLTYSNINQVLSEIRGYNIITYIILLFVLVCFVVTINIFAIEIIVYSDHTASSKEDSKNSTASGDSPKTYIMISLITAILLIPLSYFWGVYEDHIRTSYKIVQEDISNQNKYPSKYEYKINNDKSLFYAIVYENDNIYILCPIYHDDSENHIDKNQTKIIDKNGITTFQFDNINKLPPASS